MRRLEHSERRNGRWTRLRRGAVRFVVIVALTVHAGCASREIRLTHDDLTALRAATVGIARHPPPVFDVETPGNSTIGSVSGVSGGVLIFPGRSAGSGPIDAEYGIDDPAIAVRARVLDALAFEVGAIRAPTEVSLPPDDRLDAVVASVGREGWLLDVRTVRWGLVADTKLWTRYRVSVGARARLIDLAGGRVAWQGFCDATEPDAPSRSTIPELTARDAESLKTRLNEAAQRCGASLVEQLFSGVR
ncbi:MAG: hypothetical protein ACOYXR_08505 [Nitrospirota bacterium]